MGILAIAFAILSTGFPRTAQSAIASYAGPIEIPLDSNSILRADFDGDMQPDVVMASAMERGFVVNIKFSTRTPSASLTYSGIAPGLRILSRDVNHDNDADLIITSCTSLLPVAVYLGDGKGHFQPSNPWNYIPVGLDPIGHYDSTAGHDSPVSNREEKRALPGASSGELTALRPDARHALPLVIENSAAEAAFSIRSPRAPPAPFHL